MSDRRYFSSTIGDCGLADEFSSGSQAAEDAALTPHGSNCEEEIKPKGARGEEVRPMEMQAETWSEFEALEDRELSPGELYLFLIPGTESALWGLFGRETASGGLLLEAATFDLQRYATWYLLPPGYSLCRPATRPELRDFFYNLARYESGLLVKLAHKTGQ